MPEISIGGLQLHLQQLEPSPELRGRPPVIFVHGLVMDNLASWYFTVAHPVATFREVWLYDLRGHGRSQRPPSGYDLDSLVAELLGVAAQAGTGPAVLVGHSFGGLLALATAVAAPDRVAGLVLVDALLPEPGWGETMARTLSLTGQERDALIGERFTAWLGRHSRRKRTRLETQARALVEQTTLLSDLRRSRSYPDAAYAAVQAPTLALYGAESDVRGHGERLAAQLPQCTLQLVDGCTHSLMWERTDVVRERIVTWLRGR
ncbi:MAG: alpha/beta hydrolase [Myxococcales bacterium]|nr:alpha/beta hydrolase [Myxococcales bacterium]